MRKCKKCGKSLGGFINWFTSNYIDSCHNLHKGIHHSCYHKDEESEYKKYMKGDD